MKGMRLFGAAAVLGLCAQGVAAQDPGKYPWDDYDKRVESARNVASLDSDLFGDQVNLANGALSFRTTDVDAPGNSALPVSLTRTYEVKNQRERVTDYMFADWDIDLPSISGTFAPDWHGSVAGNPGRRCSVTTAPAARPPAPVWDINFYDFWQGNQLNVPGGFGGELLLARSDVAKPTTGGPYYWTTTGKTYVSCLSAVKNGTGEGFLAITPDGTKYWFDWMAQYFEPVLKSATGGNRLPRRKNVLYATRVEDRFGNTVQYEYSNAWNAPGRLTRITASDGRQINVAYNAQGHVAEVVHGSRKWSYQYAAAGSRRSLSAVVLPDASRWSIGFSPFTTAEVHYPIGDIMEPARDCFMRLLSPIGPVEVTGTIAHPSGATGTFTVGWKTHGRSHVPISCSNYDWGTSGSNTNDDVNAWVISYEIYSLTRKRLAGPGVSTAEWNYSYKPNISYALYPGGTMQVPCPVGTVCGAPLCTSESCARSAETLVAGPGGERTRYHHGNTYRYNEGKLLKVERGIEQATLEVQTHTYDLTQAPQAYPEKFGYSVQEGSDGFASEYHRPQLATSTTRGGVNYLRAVNSFDAYARPLSVTRSSPWYSRTDVTAYHDNTAKWVLGQVARVTNGNTGLVEAQTSYDGNAMPVQSWSFGKLQQTLTYNADGTVATVKDGNNNLTTVSSWKRGIPQAIGFADGTGISAAVDDDGRITRVTDENGFATHYTYDAMGRLASVAYPTGDSTAWNTTTQAFQQVTTAEYGIPAGHWRQTVATGNARRITYFDALWRPLVTREYDTANEAGTRRFQRFAYDHDGRQVFASYPGATDALSTGIWTEYDALGRTTSVAQDSELGLLITLTEYLSGNQTRVTNPRGQKTVTGYQVFDQPGYDRPAWIQHPEGAYTDIVRDVFGKPISLTRRNAGNTHLVTRSYGYDGYQQLCKAVEPETGATLMGYDGAGNLNWSSAGLASNIACEANGTSTAVAARKVARTYDARNRLKTLTFPDGRGNQAWTYTADGLPANITTHNSNGGESVVNGYAYNRRRLLTGESLSQPGYSWNLGYQYDGNGALAGLTYPSGLQVAFAPNALGQPTRAGSYATNVGYYPNGAIKQFTYGNGIVHTMTQNARQLPLRVQSGSAVGYEYEYDGNANPAKIHDLARGANYSRTLQYDGLDRLTAAGSPVFGGDHWHRFGYDALDNLTSWKLAGVKDYASYYYEPVSNRLQGIRNSANATVVGLGYDVQGNLANKNGQQYQFDFGNRLRQATGKETYRYDGHGRRVQAADAGQVPILSMYGQDGTLRRQEDHRTGKHHEYISLAGSLVAKVTTAVAPGTPSLTTPGYSDDGSYTVSWTAMPPATSYELQESVNGGNWTAAYSGTGTSKAYVGKGGGSYGYRVRACQSSSCSSWSGTGTTTVELSPASAPILSVPASVPNGGYTVSWTAVSGATTYDLEESINGGSWSSVQNTAALSKVYSGKAAGSYGYRVKACNPAGCGPVSATGTAQVFYPPGSAPTLTVPTSSTTGSYSVSWSAVTGATTYQLEEQVGSGSWGLVHSAAGSSKAISGKAAGSYGYRIKACNTAGCGPLSAVKAIQVTLPPTGKPTLTAPADNSTGGYTVSWSSVSVASSYQLEERVPGGSWAQIHSGAGTSKAISGKVAGSYEYRVKACNAAGCAGYSTVAVTRVTFPPTSAPILTLPAGSTTGGYAVSWTTVSTATTYQLEERIGTGGWTQIHSGPGTSKVVSGKAVGSYGYRVKACNAAGCGGYSAIQSITLTTPPTPANLNVAQMSNSCEAAWGASSGASHYELRNASSTIYQGANTWFSQSSPRTCLSPYTVRACNGVGCSSWSAPAHPPGDGGGGVIQSEPVQALRAREGGEE